MSDLLCEVCYRPSPETICSRRCQGLKKLKLSLDKARAQALIMNEVAKLKKDVTICPGKLSKLVVDELNLGCEEERDALSLLRELLFQMRQEGKLRFYQKNVLFPPGKGAMDIRGPFRVRGR